MLPMLATIGASMLAGKQGGGSPIDAIGGGMSSSPSNATSGADLQSGDWNIYQGGGNGSMTWILLAGLAIAALYVIRKT